MTDTQKGNLFIFMTTFLWSLGGVILKFIDFSPMTINGARSLFALGVFILYRRSIKIKINPIVIASAICLTSTNFLYVAANQLTTAANAIVIQYTAPIWVLLWNCIYQKKRPQKSEVLAMIIAFSGTILFFLDGIGGNYIIGNCLALASGLFFSGVFFLNSLPQCSSEDASMLAFIISFLISLPFIGEMVESPSVSSTVAITILGIFQVGLAYIFFSKGSRLTSPVTSSLIGLLEAIMNPFWVFLVFGERIGRYAFFGAVFIIFAVFMQIIFSKKTN